MEEYVKKFKKYVIEHLRRSSKGLNLLVSQVFLCFYLGSTEEGEFGVGFMDGQGFYIKQHIVTMVYERERVFLEANLNENGKYEYEWSYGVGNAAPYDTEEKALQVIKGLGLDAEVLYIGDSDDFAKWKEYYPQEIKRKSQVEYKEIGYPTLETIMNLGWKAMFAGIDNIPPMILKSLELLAIEHNVDPRLIRVYATTTNEEQDLVLHVIKMYNGNREYICETSLHDLILSAVMPQ